MVGPVCRDLGEDCAGVACVNAQNVCEPEVTKPRAMMSQKSKAWKVRSGPNHPRGLDLCPQCFRKSLLLSRLQWCSNTVTPMPQVTVKNLKRGLSNLRFKYKIY